MLYICNIQYVDKSETPFNIRLNNHRKDVKNPNAIPDCNYFIKHNHEFNNQEIHHYRPTKKHTHTIKWGFKKNRKLETLVPHGLIQDLNWSHAMQMCHYLPLFFVFAYGLKKLMSVIISSSTCISQILHICWERPRLRLVGKIVNFY